MKILADTHILIWMLMDTNLSEKARELLGDPNNQIYYSIISIWERGFYCICVRTFIPKYNGCFPKT